MKHPAALGNYLVDMLRARPLQTLSLACMLAATGACLDQNSKNTSDPSSSSGMTENEEAGEATMDGTMDATDTAMTMSETGSTMTGSTMTDSTTTGSTMTGSTMTGSTMTDTDTEDTSRGTGGIPDDLGLFLIDVFNLNQDDPLIDEIGQTVVMTPEANNTFLGDCSDQGQAKPETDISYVFGEVVAELPPLDPQTAMQINPPGAPPLAGGPYVVVGFATAGQMHLDDPNRSFTIGAPLATPNKMGWTNSSYPCDFYIGFNVWPQVVGSSDGSGNISAQVTVTNVVDGSPVPQTTSARVAINQELGMVVFVIPVSELPGTPLEFLMTLHTHAGDFFTDACADISSGMVGVGHTL